jgi:exodeoxyribonuclease VII small subunit
MTDSTPTQEKLPDSYEQAAQALEQLIGQLESGQLPLDELALAYQRGAALLAFCQQKLQAVEAQIQVLDEASSPTPWGPAV